MRSLFVYLNGISLLYACASSAITTTTTTQSSIQQKSQGRGGGGGGILLLKQRAPIEESSIDYGSLRTCKHKSVCEARTLLTKPYHSFHFSSSASCYSLLPNFCGLNLPFRPTTIFFFFFFAGWLADWGAWIIFFFLQKDCLPWQVCASCRTKTFGATVKYCSDYSEKGLCDHADGKMVCSCSEAPLSPAMYPKKMIGAVEGYCVTDEVWVFLFYFFHFHRVFYFSHLSLFSPTPCTFWNYLLFLVFFRILGHERGHLP